MIIYPSIVSFCKFGNIHSGVGFWYNGKFYLKISKISGFEIGIAKNTETEEKVVLSNDILMKESCI